MDKLGIGRIVNHERRMRNCIRRLVKAEIANSWKGGGDPADTPAIEKELKLAKAALNRAIAECVK